MNSTPSALFPSNRMPQSLLAVYLHFVFSTKDRHPFLTDLILRSEMHSMLGGISNQHRCIPILIGGVEDHVHILARLSRTTTQSDWVKELKRASSIWIKERELGMRDFSWQNGYGVFSVSVSNLDSVRDYIARQEEHHRKTTFQDELRSFYRKHRVEFDERYVWD